MNHPFISIIIPNYNHAPFLEERIQSVLNQSYDYKELIILDDKSTDNSLDIIKKYENNNIISHILINEDNSGSPFIQWEKGFALSKGDLIWIAESDDVCDSFFLDTLVREFEKDDNCVLAFCKTKKVDINGHVLGEEGFNDSFNIDGQVFIDNYLSRYNYIVNASSVLFSKKVLTHIDSLYTKYRGCGDWLFWMEIARAGRVAYVNLPISSFRQHGSNTTLQQNRTGKGEIEVADVMLEMKNKHLISTTAFYRAKVTHIYSVKYGRLHSVIPKTIKDEIINKWNCGVLTKILLFQIYFLHKLGIQIIRR